MNKSPFKVMVAAALAVTLTTGAVCSAISASAVANDISTDSDYQSYVLGDANRDNTVDVMDTTEIQKFINNTGNNINTWAADVNETNDVTISDVTYIQMYVANMPTGLKIGETISHQISTTETTTEPTTSAETYVYFKNSNNWSAPTAYYWSDANMAMTTWPGVAMESVGGSDYRVQVPADTTYIIFSDNGTSQTGDLTIPAFGQIYDNGNWSKYSGSTDPTTVPTSPVGDKIDVYFQNNANYSAPTAYYWSTSNYEMTVWPGTAMTLVSEGMNLYKISIPSDATNIIFSDKGTNQTGDLTLPSGSFYYDGKDWNPISEPIE